MRLGSLIEVLRNTRESTDAKLTKQTKRVSDHVLSIYCNKKSARFLVIELQCASNVSKWMFSYFCRTVRLVERKKVIFNTIVEMLQTETGQLVNVRLAQADRLGLWGVRNFSHSSISPVSWEMYKRQLSVWGTNAFPRWNKMLVYRKRQRKKSWLAFEPVLVREQNKQI